VNSKHRKIFLLLLRLYLLAVSHELQYRKKLGIFRNELILIHRVSIKSFPDYKHLLQENYMEYKYIFFKCNSI